MPPDKFDREVRAPLWYAIYDAYGKESHSSMGETGWPEPYGALVEVLKRKLGLWELAPYGFGYRGNALQHFIKVATKEQILVVIDSAEAVAIQARLLRRDALKEDLLKLKHRAQEIQAQRSSGQGDDRWYDTAQICMNGHIINRQADSHPESNLKHCKTCGAETTTSCKHCEASIQGQKHVPNRTFIDDSHPPRFCHECGKPYPWTVARIEATESFIQELEGLSDAEKISLKASIDDIIRDSPRTEPATVRIKKLLPKLGQDAATALRNLFVDVASETAKKMLTPGS